MIQALRETVIELEGDDALLYASLHLGAVRRDGLGHLALLRRQCLDMLADRLDAFHHVGKGTSQCLDRILALVHGHGDLCHRQIEHAHRLGDLAPVQVRRHGGRGA